MTITSESTTFQRMTIDVPEGELDGMRVERFTIGEKSLHNAMADVRYGRGTRPGTYTRLMDGKKLWMSDTDAEKSDHADAVRNIWLISAKRVLINGLGLGMVLQAALTFDHVEHVDVVEADERVIKLVGPHYLKDPRVTIHHADAYEQAKRWPSGTRWDVGWSDIWENLDVANLSKMALLNRPYGRRCQWHGCWGQDFLKSWR